MTNRYFKGNFELNVFPKTEEILIQNCIFKYICIYNSYRHIFTFSNFFPSINMYKHNNLEVNLRQGYNLQIRQHRWWRAFLQAIFILTLLQAICFISFPMNPQYEKCQKRKFQDSKNAWLWMDFVSLASLPAKYLEYKSISFPHAISKPCYCIAICWCSHYQLTLMKMEIC